MFRSDHYADYDYAIGVLALGDPVKLAELEQLLDGFPDGEDNFLGNPWIINAIACGSQTSIKWMLSRGVELAFPVRDGYTVLHLALERQESDKYEVIELLLQYGAPVNAHGINDWTPAHMAAVGEDIEALKLVMQYGADLSIRTGIDDYATPLEEARRLNSTRAVQFLENLAE
ncbi:MAG: ankyrin repeat domain-containing protein [Aphanocapsa sp. GSE-SYN-MK-11-07L]|jgi:ankyrin repeat protein|nr:ankyrin repeat domain-containing protein [Aphanocapsa sp. GSE-SYN-MK-11-07L]